MNILNLTQHKATPEQMMQGVIDLGENDRQQLIFLLTFNECPDVEEIKNRAYSIVRLTHPYSFDAVMIGGAGFLMRFLEDDFASIKVNVVHAFTKRVVEEKIVDGEVVKTSIFKHVDFVRTVKFD
jgi:hypothetical protein